MTKHVVTVVLDEWLKATSVRWQQGMQGLGIERSALSIEVMSGFEDPAMRSVLLHHYLISHLLRPK